MFIRLLFLFTLVPLIELFLLVKLGDVIGFWPTVAQNPFVGPNVLIMKHDPF